MLPPFTPEGHLPPGDYELTLGQLRQSMLVLGPGDSRSEWDVKWRRKLVGNLGILVKQLWKVGIREIFIGGSFVENKARPGDIDGYFVCELKRLATGELQRELNLLDPHKAWGWDPRLRHPDKHGKRQLPMWHSYRVELYPHYGLPTSGICDQFGHMLTFPSVFRQTRSFAPRGIIKIGVGQ